MNATCKMATKLTKENGIEPLYAFKNNRTVNKIHYSIMIRKSKKELLVTFSGTKNVEQLVLEIVESYPVKYFLQVGLEGAKVFEYFYWYYLEEFRKDLQVHLNKFVKQYPRYNVVFTGHSLGGALALHAAVDSILSEWIDKQKILIYTFGQPRIGNRIITDILTGTLGMFRVVHNKDLVAHIPPCIPSLSGCHDSGKLIMHPFHSPREIWYDHEMKNYKECSEEIGEDPE